MSIDALPSAFVAVLEWRDVTDKKGTARRFTAGLCEWWEKSTERMRIVRRDQSMEAATATADLLEKSWRGSTSARTSRA